MTKDEALSLALDWFICYQDKSMSRNNAEALTDEIITAIKEALAQPEQEPVALEAVYETIIHWDEGGGKRSRRELARRIVSLYHTSPQRKPLTDEEIMNIAKVSCIGISPQEDTLNFAKVIEAVHGIKE